MPVRDARRSDFARLQEIELAAGEMFREVGLPEIAEHDPPTDDELLEYVAASQAWVMTDADDVALAYVVVDIVDREAHIEQVSVHPDAARQGLGAQLLEHVAAWATASGMATMTLTTFGDVPWNGPYYERLGFRVLTEDELGPELREVRDHQAALWRDPSRRVVMRRVI